MTASICFCKNYSSSPYPRLNINFTFNLDDLEFAYFLKNKFNMGRVSDKNGSHSCKWIISKESEILQLLIFCNGYFRTGKIEALQRGLTFFKLKHNIDIPLKPLDTSPLLSNGWFAGFSEGDSHFLIECRTDKNYPNSKIINTAYCLQVAENYCKKVDEKIGFQSNKYFMEEIAKTFGVKIHFSKSKPTATRKQTSSINLKVSKIESLNLMLEYFTNFPIFSSKYLNYLDWKKIIDLKCENRKKELSLLHIFPIAEKIKNGVNSKRTYFNWDHLESFYSLPEDFPKAIKLKKFNSKNK